MEHSIKSRAQVRLQPDRRRGGVPSLRALLLHPRRRKVRRDVDRSQLVILDWYPEVLLSMASIVLVLSATDALLTLFLLQHGAHEVNPLLAYCLEKGPVTFLVVKYTLTAIAVTIVVLVYDVFIPFLRLQARDLLKVFAGIFVAVIVWQLYLVGRHVL